MTNDEAKAAIREGGLGCYRLYWSDNGGDSSVAAVGMDWHGRLWFAPTNWVTVPCYDWSRVLRVELIETQSGQESEILRRERDELIGLVGDRIEDDDLAREAARRERERCRARWVALKGRIVATLRDECKRRINDPGLKIAAEFIEDIRDDAVTAEDAK